MSSFSPRLLGLSGSIRRDSYNTAVLTSLAQEIKGKATLDVRTLENIPPYDSDLEVEGLPEVVAVLKQEIAEADGIILSSPEYNWGMSGILKNAIDWASRPTYGSPFKGKPVLFLSASPGGLGGARAHSQMREAMTAVLARPVVCPPVTIAAVDKKMQDGKLTDPATLKFAGDAIDALLEEIALLRAPVSA
jgi:chromate reductase